MDGFLKIIFVKTSENTADIFTKNVSTDTHEKFKDDYIWKREDMAHLCFSAQQEGCCEVLIENTKTAGMTEFYQELWLCGLENTKEWSIPSTDGQTLIMERLSHGFPHREPFFACQYVASRINSQIGTD